MRGALAKCGLLLCAVVGGALLGSVHAREDSEANESSTLQLLAEQAERLKTMVKSAVAKEFLGAVDHLPAIGEPRIVYYNRSERAALSEAQAANKSEADLEGFEKQELGEQFYYFTRYGTPLAFVRPLDLVGQAGLGSVDGAKIADFGFGSIGQLRLLALNGAEAVGIDVDPLLQTLYDRPADTGTIRREGKTDGRVRLLFGQFPAEPVLVEGVGKGFALFISKNTLKRGYIHPEQEVDPRRLVHLGVDDETFVQAVYDLLEPGGYFMIYNLCPPQSEDPDQYIPWADGRSPFSRALYENVGFKVLAFDRDDTPRARAMGRLLGWDELMDLEHDLFGIYTLLRK